LASFRREIKRVYRTFAADTCLLVVHVTMTYLKYNLHASFLNALAARSRGKKDVESEGLPRALVCRGLPSGKHIYLDQREGGKPHELRYVVESERRAVELSALAHAFMLEERL